MTLGESHPSEEVTVVVNGSGRIIATAHKTAEPAEGEPEHMEIVAGSDQRVFTLSVPEELSSLELAERIDRLHNAYGVDKDGVLRRLADGES